MYNTLVKVERIKKRKKKKGYKFKTKRKVTVAPTNPNDTLAQSTINNNITYCNVVCSCTYAGHEMEIASTNELTKKNATTSNIVI